jgi:hypothetical protein
VLRFKTDIGSFCQLLKFLIPANKEQAFQPARASGRRFQIESPVAKGALVVVHGNRHTSTLQ